MGNSVKNMHSDVGVQRVRMWRIQPFHSKIQKQLSIIKNTLTDEYFITSKEYPLFIIVSLLTNSCLKMY